jgi:DNA replication protein DnaC
MTAANRTNTAPIDQVVDLLRQLQLPHMCHQAPELLATAKAQGWDPAEALRALLAEELADRRASSINIRRTAAGFPTGKALHTWVETVSSIPAPTQRSLTTLEWFDRHENLVVCGPYGTGKSHLLEALGHAAIGLSCHVQRFSLETLGALINRHRVDDSTSRVIMKIMRADLPRLTTARSLGIGKVVVVDVGEGVELLLELDDGGDGRVGA